MILLIISFLSAQHVYLRISYLLIGGSMCLVFKHFYLYQQLQTLLVVWFFILVSKTVFMHEDDFVALLDAHF